ncbi:MAG TPA: sulfotransferase domain-containing protein [Terriglobales bacterium]|jgi:hypothetical protein|nr:sulfotransferase domain-containing protein [Terriglobales bacterium]
MHTLRRIRYRLARSGLRAPLVWVRHRGLQPEDVILASYERSGSTWLRFLLQEILTGWPAEFFTVNRVIPEMGTHRGVGPVLPGGGRLIKTHERFRREYGIAVYLVRDVRDVLLSNYARHCSLGLADYVAKGPSFDAYLHSFLEGTVTHVGSWQDHVQSWLDSPLAGDGRLLIVRFEDLRQETRATLANILKFLGVAVEPFVIDAAIRNNSLEKMRAKEDGTRNSRRRLEKGVLGRAHKDNGEDGRFVRQGAVAGWREKLTPEHVRLIETYAGGPLFRLGYPSGLTDPVRFTRPVHA